MTKQLAVIGAAVMTTLLALVVLWQFRIVVIYVLISLTLTAALRPLANRLVGRGLLARVTWSSTVPGSPGQFRLSALPRR